MLVLIAFSCHRTTLAAEAGSALLLSANLPDCKKQRSYDGKEHCDRCKIHVPSIDIKLYKTN